MTLADATAGFLDYIRQTPTSVTPQLQSDTYQQTARLLIDYFSADSPLSDVTEANLRDFLGRYYPEKACASKLNVSESIESKESDQLPTPQELLASIADFFRWADQNGGAELTARCSHTITELSQTLPQAIEITRLLTSWIQERCGAFSFPEFLTSFEEGGRSQYDIDTPGNIGALEGYFRIVRVEGSLVDVENLISEERVWSIIFPSEVSALLDRPYVINLELVQTKGRWQIASCGFAYPPGTEV